MEMFKAGGKVLIGKSKLKEQLSIYNKAFIVCDPFIAETGKTEYVTSVLDELNIPYVVFAKITPDPSVEIVTEGISILADFGADVAIGFGGGSAIDACKAMIFFARHQNLTESMDFIAIPTTSGTGSEVTDFAVITDKEKGIKYPIIDESIAPNVAVLDAELTVTVPPAITAMTGMDVVTHAIEALVSTNATDFSDAAAEKSIKLVRANLLTAYNEPSNMEARQAMHNASCLAGIAFNNAGLGLNHGMAHALGGKFHIPHGKANALLLPYVMGYNAGCFDSLNDNAKKYARIARLLCVDSSSIRQSSFNLIRAVKTFIKKLGLPSTIAECGISEEEFREALDAMAEAAYNDKCTATNPRTPSVEEIKSLYLHAYYGNAQKK